MLWPFVTDLLRHDDRSFARRVLSKCFTERGGFREDQDDHRLRGIPNGWIRYVSAGRTAYRAIFIREGSTVRLYRAGGHDVEDRLVEPADRDGIICAGSVEDESPPATSRDAKRLEDEFIFANRPKRVIQLFRQRRLVPHREVTLVAPFVSSDLLWSTSVLGKMLADWREDGAQVGLITRPPTAETLGVYEQLQARGVDVSFCQRLHSKLYVFRVDSARSWSRYSDTANRPEDMFVIGSSNLTHEGLGLDGSTANEELCYVLPLSVSEKLETYLVRLITDSLDVTQAKLDLRRGRLWQ